MILAMSRAGTHIEWFTGLIPRRVYYVCLINYISGSWTLASNISDICQNKINKKMIDDL